MSGARLGLTSAVSSLSAGLCSSVTFNDLLKAAACSADHRHRGGHRMSGQASFPWALSACWCVCVILWMCHVLCGKCAWDYMSDSRLSAMLVWPSGTDPLVSGLCRALWSSWLLTRLSTARYRYWYCSCRGAGWKLETEPTISFG